MFTDPQVASVGLTEAARARRWISGSRRDNRSRSGAARRDTRGLIKLVADAGSDQLLGAQIFAPDSIRSAARSPMV